MATLKGLFDPKPRNRRNFLLENKREIRVKSTSNGLKNAVPVNLPQKPKTSVVSSKCISRPSTLEGRCRLSQNAAQHSSGIHSKSSPCLRNDSLEKIQQSKQVSNHQPSSRSKKSLGSARTMHYIHHENVPFEWTEICPSLISHSICHQGVQTDEERYENLTKQLGLLGTEDMTDRNCDNVNKQVSPPAPSVEPGHHNITPKDKAQKGQNSNDVTDRFMFDNKKMYCTAENIPFTSTHAEKGLDGSPSNEVIVKEVKGGENVSKKTTVLIPHHEKSMIPSSRKVAVTSTESDDSHYYPASYQKGVIPKYLTQRKAEQALASAQAKEIDPNCPAGHVAMPDEERRETLDMILKNYNKLISELNRIPVRTDTLKMKLRKIEIEKQLDKLEEGIRVFSRSKVYVKLDV